MEANECWPKVGITVLIFKDGKVLMGKRKGSHGAGQLAFVGGKMEYMELFPECAQREVFEETGLEIENIQFLRLYNLTSYAPKHYVDIAFTADWKSGTPEVKEPEKCVSWDWYDIDKIPMESVFSGIESCVIAYKTGKNFFDS